MWFLQQLLDFAAQAQLTLVPKSCHFVETTCITLKCKDRWPLVIIDCGVILLFTTKGISIQHISFDSDY